METYLIHHGILGQKWGIRRYQNPDGSLTEAGKKKIYKEDGTLTQKGRKLNQEFYKNVEENWWKTYNKATNEFNKNIGNINKKYDFTKVDSEYTNKEGQKYVKEVNKYWKNLYIQKLKEDYGESIDRGYEYINDAPFMNMYADLIK